jgi:hypothetical protein
VDGDWELIFDAARPSPDILVAGTFAVGALIVAAVLRGARRIQHGRLQRPAMITLIGILLITSAGLALAPLARAVLYPDEEQAIDRSPLVEGAVTNFVRTPKGELFDVEGIHFFVSPYVSTQGFNTMGRIESGSFVRIHYVPGTDTAHTPLIVRLERRR